MNNTGGDRQLFAVHIFVLGMCMQCHAIYGTVLSQPYMTDTIAPSETQTLHCIYCTLQLVSNPDHPWTCLNLHGRPQFEATLTPLDQYRTCILLMHIPHDHTYVHVHYGPPPTKKEQEQVLEKSFNNEKACRDRIAKK